MEVKLFDEIMINLNNLIAKCESTVGNITCKDDIENLPLKQVRCLIDDCRDILSDMTKIVTNELYHIIGMGNLTVVQQSKFTSRIQLLLTYRPDIQCIASIVIPNTPKIPTKNEHKLSVLSNVKLSISSEARLKKHKM